ncbi:3-ketoacyl-CoA synthase [Zostera marina]|uniref:3-ketoacyl-CoA synthase n=1 Tax=Zostera marina TaxID=29655 RepID=A0A0K9NJ22_ZOSMR|nr:3-ketoacyl-CoA synthase [Zostera marina]
MAIIEFFISIFLSMEEVRGLFETELHRHVGVGVVLASLIMVMYMYLFMSRPAPVYLVDFACFKPPSTCRVPFSTFMEHSRLMENFNNTSVEFQQKILQRSGLGEETALPPANHFIPPKQTMDAARAEAELVIFSTIDDLVARTGLDLKNVDMLVVNCSLFSPTPSLSAMIVNKYKMRSNVKSYNLSGMGCSAGLLSVDLVRDLLQVHPKCNALVISTEIITPNWYAGNERAMLLPNCLFRMGGAAVFLSNQKIHRSRAKYELKHLIRTHKGQDDRAYRCVYQEEDSEGITGISLSKDLMTIAGDALTSNITKLGPLVLPWSEQLRFAVALFVRKAISRQLMKPYIPDFKKAFDHYCIHAGGRAVIDELHKNLHLTDQHVEASRMTLHRFGNTSSSSLWYELAYIEAKGRMKRGDRVWQIAFGSGFKCNSAVWKCRRNLDSTPVDSTSPWADCVDRYPVVIPKVVNF